MSEPSRDKKAEIKGRRQTDDGAKIVTEDGGDVEAADDEPGAASGLVVLCLVLCWVRPIPELVDGKDLKQRPDSK